MNSVKPTAPVNKKLKKIKDGLTNRRLDRSWRKLDLQHNGLTHPKKKQMTLGRRTPYFMKLHSVVMKACPKQVLKTHLSETIGSTTKLLLIYVKVKAVCR